MSHRPGEGRALTAGEVALARTVFGDAIDYAAVTIRRQKWAAFQPRHIVMAPMGHLHFHPRSPDYCDSFCEADIGRQGLFIHELVHIWQAQTRGRWYLPLMRHPFARYSYRLRPGWKLARYGLEQQAEIVRHYFLMTRGLVVPGAPSIEAYRAILPFQPAR